MTPHRRNQPVSLRDAAEAAPTLARLVQLARESADRLEAVKAVIPVALRSAVRPGPIDGATWCLLVENNAAAAKLRQVLPAMQRLLAQRACEVNSIRLKVERGGK
ncbi:hypothetical protein [Ramlibacter sp.]|uniref:hypothetical protein n=1 Tax=Ramlibacter sp. TaxID=1917967 RepID=UPI003D122619